MYHTARIAPQPHHAAATSHARAARLTAAMPASRGAASPRVPRAPPRHSSCPHCIRLCLYRAPAAMLMMRSCAAVVRQGAIREIDDRVPLLDGAPLARHRQSGAANAAGAASMAGQAWQGARDQDMAQGSHRLGLGAALATCVVWPGRGLACPVRRGLAVRLTLLHRLVCMCGSFTTRGLPRLWR